MQIIICKNHAKLILLHNTFNNQPQEPFWSGLKPHASRSKKNANCSTAICEWTSETLR